MPTREEYVEEVTEFLAKAKTLAGIDMPIPWQPNREPDEMCIKVPIEVDGIVSEQKLIVVFFPAYPTLKFTILIVFGVAICRLDFDETGGHTNGFLNLEHLPTIVQGSHFHRWSSNVRFVQGYAKLPELRNAEAIPTIRNFNAALRWFCDEAHIALPHNHQIELPPRVLI